MAQTEDSSTAYHHDSGGGAVVDELFIQGPRMDGDVIPFNPNDPPSIEGRQEAMDSASYDEKYP
jgi:hypothetical protein